MSAADATGATPSPFAEPTVRRGPGWISLFALAWLGIWLAQLTPVQLLLPVQVEEVVNAGIPNDAPTLDWLGSVVWFGIVSGIAGVFVVIAYPLTGALSDRTMSRFGRRRPWILSGAIVFAASLVVLGAQDTLIGIIVCWTLALIGFCMLTAALTATISDQVPVGQRGLVSGWMSAPQAIGIIGGLLLVTEVVTGRLPGYAAVAGILIILVIPFLAAVPDARLPARDARLSLRGILSDFWISPVKYPDFGWTLGSRILVNLANALGTTLLLYFLQFGLRREDAEGDLVLLTLVYLVFVMIGSLGLGWLSDRLGRRKPFVLAAALLQGAAALILALVPSFDAVMVGAALLGAGYGCFLAVDQALATQVLPDPETRGKDLGIMNIATAAPQAFAPLVGAGLVVAVGGFTLLFVVTAIVSVVGALAVLPVKKVR